MLTQRLLDEEVSVTENGQQRVFSRVQVIFEQMVNKAALGDKKFQTLLLEYAPSLDVKLSRRRHLPANAEALILKSFLSED